MNKNMRTLALLAAAAWVAAGAYAADQTLSDDGVATSEFATGNTSSATGNGSLTTLFARNNGFRGNSFDLTASTCMEVVGWDFNVSSGVGSTGNVSIYWRVGTASGFENNGGTDWYLLGTAPIVGAGTDNPSHLDLGGLVLQAGDLVGIYYYMDDYPTIGAGYTNGSNVYSNTDLSLKTLAGIGTTTPFGAGGLFLNRQVNVTVHYDTAGPACNTGEKVRLCHIPPGNPCKGHVIEVGAPAVPAHLAHGDCYAKGKLSKGDDCTCP